MAKQPIRRKKTGPKSRKLRLSKYFTIPDSPASPSPQSTRPRCYSRQLQFDMLSPLRTKKSDKSPLTQLVRSNQQLKLLKSSTKKGGANNNATFELVMGLITSLHIGVQTLRQQNGDTDQCIEIARRLQKVVESLVSE